MTDVSGSAPLPRALLRAEAINEQSAVSGIFLSRDFDIFSSNGFSKLTEIASMAPWTTSKFLRAADALG